MTRLGGAGPSQGTQKIDEPPRSELPSEQTTTGPAMQQAGTTRSVYPLRSSRPGWSKKPTDTSSAEDLISDTESEKNSAPLPCIQESSQVAEDNSANDFSAAQLIPGLKPLSFDNKKEELTKNPGNSASHEEIGCGAAPSGSGLNPPASSRIVSDYITPLQSPVKTVKDSPYRETVTPMRSGLSKAISTKLSGQDLALEDYFKTVVFAVSALRNKNIPLLENIIADYFRKNVLNATYKLEDAQALGLETNPASYRGYTRGPREKTRDIAERIILSQLEHEYHRDFTKGAHHDFTKGALLIGPEKYMLEFSRSDLTKIDKDNRYEDYSAEFYLCKKLCTDPIAVTHVQWKTPVAERVEDRILKNLHVKSSFFGFDTPFKVRVQIIAKSVVINLCKIYDHEKVITDKEAWVREINNALSPLHEIFENDKANNESFINVIKTNDILTSHCDIGDLQCNNDNKIEILQKQIKVFENTPSDIIADINTIYQHLNETKFPDNYFGTAKFKVDFLRNFIGKDIDSSGMINENIPTYLSEELYDWMTKLVARVNIEISATPGDSKFYIRGVRVTEACQRVAEIFMRASAFCAEDPTKRQDTLTFFKKVMSENSLPEDQDFFDKHLTVSYMTSHGMQALRQIYSTFKKEEVCMLYGMYFETGFMDRDAQTDLNAKNPLKGKKAVFLEMHPNNADKRNINAYSLTEKYAQWQKENHKSQDKVTFVMDVTLSTFPEVKHALLDPTIKAAIEGGKLDVIMGFPR